MMAAKVEAQSHQGLICPLCLDTFVNPTLLTCGHSFCKNCLIRYDQERRGVYSMACPVCKKRTKLGTDRVKGFPPNFLFKAIEDELYSKVDGSLSNFCSLHNQIYKDILCDDCEEFICLSCYVNDHQGHKIRKKEELDANMKKERDTLVQKGQAKKKEIEKSINNAEQNKLAIHSHLDNLEREIKNSFAKKVTHLQEKEERLLKEVNDIRRDSDKIVEVCISRQRQLADNISSCLTVQKGTTIQCTDLDTLNKHRAQFRELEDSLQKVSNEECTAHVRKSAENAQFSPGDEEVLELGHLELRERSVDGILCQHMETAGCGSKDADKMESENVPNIPVEFEEDLAIVRNVELPECVCGMAALSQDEVVVGYGCSREGTDCFSVKGGSKPHLSDDIGDVYDIAFLTDGRLVVSHEDKCSVYYPHGEQKTGTEYISKPSVFMASLLCSDHQDNIYTISGHQEINVFNGSHPYPCRVETTKGIPERICVTKTGAMITNSSKLLYSKVSVYFRGKGPLMCSSRIGKKPELLCAAVDCHDRVLIAMVKIGSCMLTLTRYTLQQTELIEEKVFKPLELPNEVEHPNIKCNMVMVSLSPNLIAFAIDSDLHFIELSD